MAYGSFNRMQFAATKSIRSTITLTPGSPVVTTSGWESLNSFPSPQIVRSGTNTPDFFKRDDVLITSVSFIRKKKLVGYRYTYRVKKYYVKGQDTGEPIALLKKEKVKHPVYVRTYVPVVKTFERLVDRQLLLAPNQLSFTYDSKAVDKESNTFVRYTWSGQDVISSAEISTIGVPGDLVFRNSIGLPYSIIYDAYMYNPNWNSTSIPPDPSIITELDRMALSKLYRKVGSEFPDFLTEFAQLNQSISTLKSVLSKGIKLARTLKRLDIKTLKKGTSELMPKELSNHWLEYIYGVAPLVSTIQDSIKLYNRQARTWRTYSAEVSDVISSDLTFGFPDSPFYPNKLSSCHEKKFTQISIRYGVIMSATSSFDRYMTRANTVSAAAATAWELVPWSFVLDWVYDIGGFLANHNAIDEHLLHAWRTTTISSSSIASHTPSGRNSSYSNSFDFSPFKVTSVHNTCNREILSSVPDMPRPSLKGYSDSVSLGRSINLLALLLQKSP